MIGLGIYCILDGFGSILVYHDQPFWFDHFVRVCRMLAGMIGVVVGFAVW